jgi:hypothetical protein
VKRCVFAVVSALTLLNAVALGASGAKPSKEELAAITSRGILLWEYDQAAWHATDAVQAAHPPDGKVQRYIARKTATGWIVDFGRLNQAGDKFLIACEAVTKDASNNFSVRTFDPEQAATGFDLAAAKAIGLALADFGGANRPYNAAVLPAAPEGLFVYLYPAQTKYGVYPYGGDVRYLIASDGTSIITKRQMHKTVLEFNSTNVATRVAAGYHTHVVTDLPEDTDVFLVLSRQPKVPEFIGAGGHIFVISTDGKITITKK